jgi:transposase
VVCRPGDPEAKGLVERAHRYLETSFLPGRSFSSPEDFNTRLSEWLERANARVHRRIECRPIDRLQADLDAMVPLPPVAPVTGWHHSVILPRDHYVRVASNDYSVHPAVVGRRVRVAADLERVTVRCDGKAVADHLRCWARHQSITDPEHARAGEDLPRARGQLRLEPGGDDVEQRDLADYDRALGVGEGVA